MWMARQDGQEVLTSSLLPMYRVNSVRRWEPEVRRKKSDHTSAPEERS